VINLFGEILVITGWRISRIATIPEYFIWFATPQAFDKDITGMVIFPRTEITTITAGGTS